MDYRELAFYHKASEVVRLINVESNKWQNTIQAQSISRQLFRAATSIGYNIAEGHGRHMGHESSIPFSSIASSNTPFSPIPYPFDEEDNL